MSALMRLVPLEGADEAAPSLMIFAGDEATLRLLSDAVADRTDAVIELGGIEAAIAHFQVAASPPRLLVDLAGAAAPLAAIGRLADVCAPTTDLIVVGEVNDVEFYRALRAAGVADYLVKPVSAAAITATLSAIEQGAAGGPHKPPRRPDAVIAVVGACGGSGATLVASSLAWISAREQRRRTMLVDLDIHYGGAALALNVPPTHGLCEALETPRLIDGLLIASATTSLGENFSLLCSEEPLDSLTAPAADAIEPLLDQLRSDYQRIILDVPRRNLDLLRQTLPHCGTIVIVTDFSLIGARDTRRMLTLAKSLAPEARLVLLGNRIGKPGKGAPSRAEMQQAIGLNFAALIPEDVAAVPRALSLGKPLLELASAGPAAVALRALAASIGIAPPAPAKRLARLFGIRKRS